MLRRREPERPGLSQVPVNRGCPLSWSVSFNAELAEKKFKVLWVEVHPGGPPLNPPGFVAGSTPSMTSSNSLCAAKLEFKVSPQLGREGDIPQQEKEATFQLQNLHLNQFINPTVQIRRAGRRGRREEFTESRAKKALLNTSFLFWTFSQWLLNLPRLIKKDKKKKLHPLCAGFRRQPCPVVL